jgi:hypothetical protein
VQHIGRRRWLASGGPFDPWEGKQSSDSEKAHPSTRAISMSDGEIWTAYGGVNPCGLFVRRGYQELRTRWLC